MTDWEGDERTKLLHNFCSYTFDADIIETLEFKIRL
jgi:hypothetical protein